MKKIILSIATAFVISNAQAQLDRSVRPKAGPAPEIKMGDAQSFTLPNGLKVFVVENHKVPAVSYQISLDITPALQGNAIGYKDFMGELLMSGTKTKSKDAFNEALDGIGAQINAGNDGVYAACLSKQQEKMLALLSDMLLNPNFTQAELTKIKTQSISGLKSNEDDPEAMSNNMVSAMLFGKGHAYGEVQTEASTKAITLDMCKKYYSTYFRPNVAYMAVVGDITMQQAKDLITKYFAKWQRAAVPVASYETPKDNTGARVAVVNKTGAVQSVVNVTYPINIKPGTPDVVKLRVANSVLGGGSAGRLFQNLRETHGWTYGSYSNVSFDKLENSSMFSATANCKTASTDSSVKEIIAEMNRLKTEKVEDETLESIKRNMAGKFALGLEDPKTLARYAIRQITC
jgi:zinc protease